MMGRMLKFFQLFSMIVRHGKNGKNVCIIVIFIFD